MKSEAKAIIDAHRAEQEAHGGLAEDSSWEQVMNMLYDRIRDPRHQPGYGRVVLAYSVGPRGTEHSQRESERLQMVPRSSVRELTIVMKAKGLTPRITGGTLVNLSLA